MERMSPEAEQFFKKAFGKVPPTPPIWETLDARLDDVDRGHATVSMNAHQGLHNIIRVVHGGVLSSLAELAASVALITAVDEDESFTFISQTTNFERPVQRGRVAARAEVVRKGRRISFVEVVLAGDDGREVARAELTALSQTISH